MDGEAYPCNMAILNKTIMNENNPHKKMDSS